MALPKTTHDRIKDNASTYCKDEALGSREDCSYCMQDYIAGATAENERAQTGIDLLKSMVLEFGGAAEVSDKDYDKNLIKKCKAFLQQWNAGKDIAFKGSIFTEPVPGIALGRISPEARELLDTIMEQWEAHYKTVKTDTYEPTFYGFAYWLVRWSGLIKPMPKNEPMPEGCPYCGSPECTSDHK